MKRFLNGFGIFLVVLIIGLIFSSVKGIFWPDKDIIAVTSKNAEGVKFAKEYNVKFLPDRVIGTFWTDFYISAKGKYVYDFIEDAAGEKISYRILEEKFVSIYQLQKKYSWWQSYGLLALLGLGIIISIFGEDLWRVVFSIADEV